MESLVQHNKQQNLQIARQNILANPVVREKLNRLEMMVCETGAINKEDLRKTLLERIDLETLLELVKKSLPRLTQDIGIKNWDSDSRYDSIRFTEFIKTYYPIFTFSEVELAFELLLVGQLDEFLPLNSHGEPDRNHYQSFSVGFYSKVLSAFSHFKRRVWSKAILSIPEETKTITVAQKQEFRNHIVQTIHQAFDAYKDKDESPKFAMEFLIIEELIKARLIKDYPKITHNDRKIALVSFIDKTTSNKYDKDKMKSDFKEKQPNKRLDDFAKIESMRRQIKKVFDKLIEKKEHIANYVK